MVEYLEKMKKIQDLILEFLDSNDDKQNFNDLDKLLSFVQNQPDIQELKSILYLISRITQNHHRGPFFFDKIKKIIINLKLVIKQSFSNIEIFNIFKKNKRILLLLLDEKIITFNSDILSQISQFKDYFYTEFNTINSYDESIELPKHYEEKRRIGENDSYICELIRNDNLDEFIIYYNKSSFSLTMTIEPSIYETNAFLEKKKPKLIEYATFFGSIQIIRFLFQNQVKLNSSLWLYSIHGSNPEIIHFLEENQIKPEDETYTELLKESIKCHHNDLAMYFSNNFVNDQYLSRYENSYGFHFYNFQFIPIELEDKNFFYYAVKYDYYKLVGYYKDIEGLDINELIVFLLIFELNGVFCLKK